jgi:hypothetical protein
MSVRIIRCVDCLFYSESKCKFMYIQKPEGVSLFEKSETVRENPKLCGKEAKWFIGKGSFVKIDDAAKKVCYDK